MRRFNSTKQTYLNARNKLIESGLIKQTYRGGMCRGDRAKYKLLYLNDVPISEQRWRKYPDQNWLHEIPKVKKLIVGKKTQFTKGKTGRKKNSTLFNSTLNPLIDPNKFDSSDE